MISLRHKLWTAFGGLLMVVVAVSVVTVAVLTRYSHALEQVLRDNFDSSQYCHEMQDALGLLDSRAQRLIWDGAGAGSIDATDARRRFEQALQLQVRNSMLPGELDRSRKVAAIWDALKTAIAGFDALGVGVRPIAYRDQLLPRIADIRRTTGELAEMNVASMTSVDGRVKRTLVRVRTALIILVLAGVALAGTIIWAAGAGILHRLRALTASARQIEAGNLGLTLTVGVRDEIGQLAEAFNAMTGQLREFRRLDHDRLARTQQTTQLAIDSLPDAVIVIGPSGRVEISNRTAVTHFAIKPGAAVADLGLKWLNTLHTAVLADSKPIEPQGYAGVVQLFESGEERFLLPRAVPMVGDRNELIGVAIVLADVTRLRQVDEAKSNLISTVSHELRTPLTGVRMSLSLLASKNFGVLSADQSRLVGVCRDDSDRLQRIIENLLTMSRMESGRSQFQFRRMTAGELLSAAIEPLRSSFTDRSLDLHTAGAPDLPPLLVDPVAMGLALTNLLTNALKFTPSGGAIRVSAEAEEGLIVLQVADTGPGIPEKYRARLFEKFFRVPTASGPSGAGLGLAITQSIAEAHGGRVDFVCPETGGSVFRLRLPPAPGAGATSTG